MTADGISRPEPLKTDMTVGVYNDQNEKIGSLEDLILKDGNHIAIGVVSVGGFLGIGNKLVAVPYDQLHLETDRDQTKITMPGASKEALKAMPTFTYSGSSGRTVREPQRLPARMRMPQPSALLMLARKRARAARARPSLAICPLPAALWRGRPRWAKKASPSGIHFRCRCAGISFPGLRRTPIRRKNSTPGRRFS
jgi:hypothetical protein